jgi:hypothetical protein
MAVTALLRFTAVYPVPYPSPTCSGIEFWDEWCRGSLCRRSITPVSLMNRTPLCPMAIDRIATLPQLDCSAPWNYCYYFLRVVVPLTDKVLLFPTTARRINPPQRPQQTSQCPKERAKRRFLLERGPPARSPRTSLRGR